MHILMLAVVSSCVMSAIILAMLLFRALFSKAFRSKWRYIAWVVVLLGIVIPFRPMIGEGFYQVKQPITEQAAVVLEQEFGEGIEPTVMEAQHSGVGSGEGNATAASKDSTDWLQMMVWGWGIVAIAVFALHILQHFRFVRFVRRWSAVAKEDMLRVFQAVKEQEGLETAKIGLKTCGLISSSMLTGFFKPTVLLPDRDFADDELQLIFKHELIHYKRRDLFVNVLEIFAISLNWFNPFMYMMRAAVRSDCETSCDEVVLKDSNEESRRIYGEVIIGMCTGGRVPETALSTCFYSKKSNVKRRLDSIMDTKKRRMSLSVLLVSFVAVLTLLSGSIVAFAAPSDTYIGTTKAKEIALKHANLTAASVTFIKAKLERDDGMYVYDIDFYSGNVEYDYEIGALTGEILEYDRDIENYVILQPTNSGNTSNKYIGKTKAKQIVLKHADISSRSVRRYKCELDRENGRWQYEIEFVSGRMEYEYEIDAWTGEILQWESERD